MNLNEKYKVVGKLGEGGMGIVYKAYDTTNKNIVAIKSIKPNKLLKPIHMKRFYREIEVTAKLNHPNIIKIFFFGQHNNLPYFIMEYIKGLTLEKYIYTQSPTLEEKLSIIIKVLDALTHAHKKKILHRDLKPSNIFIRQNGSPVLMDFGLAKNNEIEDKSLTQSGEVIGTPQYMAPEQARGLKKAIDQKTDVYAMGAILYYVLTKTPPASGESMVEVLYQVIEKKVEFTNKDIPEDIKNICKKALEKKKKDRYCSAESFAQDIQNFISQKKIIANSFYRKRKIYCILKYASLAIIMATFLFFTSFWEKEKTNTYSHILKKWKELKQEKNLVLKHIKLMGIWQESKIHQGKKWKKLTSHILSSIILNYCKQSRYSQYTNSIESLISINRAQSLFQKQKHNIPKSRIKRLQKHILEQKIATHFYAKHYKEVYQLGKELKKKSQEIKWKLAVSSYYCEYEMAKKLFKEIEQSSLRSSEQYVGSIYYQGMLFYKRKNYSKAREYFSSAIQLLKKEYSFFNELILYYTACRLIHHKKQPKEELNKIQSIFNRIQGKKIRSRLIYKETLGKYLLAKLRNTNSSIIAHRIIKLMDECIAIDPENATYFYLRSVAYRYIGNYKQAIRDCEHSFYLAPNQFESMFEKLTLMEIYPKTERIKKELDTLPLQIRRSISLALNLFEREEKELKSHYNRVHLEQINMEFSINQFDLFYKKLFMQEKDIRLSYLKAICSIKPNREVQKKCMQKYQKKDISPKEKIILKTLLKMLKETERKEKKIRTLLLLSRKSLIKESKKEYFLQNIAILEEIAFSKWHKNENSTSILIRLNALRALALLKSYRLSLVKKFYSSEQKIEKRILIAKALYEIGISYFKDHCIVQYLKRGENTFIKTIGISVLEPITHKGTKEILTSMLYDKNERIRTLAASRFINSEIESITPKIIKIFIEGHRSKNEHIRAFSVYYFWSNNFFRNHMRKKHKLGKKYYPYFLKALKDPSNIVRFSAFVHIKNLYHTYRMDDTAARKIVKKILERNSSPLMRYHSIIALGKLRDKSVLSDIGLNRKKHVFERLIALTSVMTVKTKKFGISYLLTEIGKNFHLETDQRLIGFLIYSLGYGVSITEIGKKTKVFSSMIFGFIGNAVLNWLEGESDFLRIIAILSIYNISHTPPKYIKAIEKLSQDPQKPLDIRMASIGALTSLYLRNHKFEKVNKIHNWIKKKRDNSYNSLHCRSSVIRGYYSFIKAVMEYLPDLSYITLSGISLRSKEKMDYEKIRRFKIHIRRNKIKFLYIQSLKRIMDILFSVDILLKKEQKWLENCSYKLGLIYKAQRKYKLAKYTIKKALQKMDWQSEKLIAFYASLLEKMGEERKALKLLIFYEKKYRKDFPVAIMRTLGKFYSKRGEYKKALTFLKQQYYIDAKNPAALSALGHYYCDVKKYDKAYKIFLKFYRNHKRSNPINDLGKARVFASKGNIGEAIDALRAFTMRTQAFLEDFTFPEFHILKNNKKFKRLYKKVADLR